MDGAAGSNQAGEGAARARGHAAGDGEAALLAPHATAALVHLCLHQPIIGTDGWTEEDMAWLEGLDYVGLWAERGGREGPLCAAMVRRALFDAATGARGDGPLDAGAPAVWPRRHRLLAFAAFGVSRAYMPPSFFQALVSEPCADGGAANTLLHLAAAGNNIGVAQVLTLAGAPLHTRNAAGLTPFQGAVAHLRYEVVAYWLQSDKARQLCSRVGDDGSGPTVWHLVASAAGGGTPAEAGASSSSSTAARAPRDGGGGGGGKTTTKKKKKKGAASAGGGCSAEGGGGPAAAAFAYSHGTRDAERTVQALIDWSDDERQTQVHVRFGEARARLLKQPGLSDARVHWRVRQIADAERRRLSLQMAPYRADLARRAGALGTPLDAAINFEDWPFAGSLVLHGASICSSGSGALERDDPIVLVAWLTLFLNCPLREPLAVARAMLARPDGAAAVRKNRLVRLQPHDTTLLHLAVGTRSRAPGLLSARVMVEEANDAWMAIVSAQRAAAEAEDAAEAAARGGRPGRAEAAAAAAPRARELDEIYAANEMIWGLLEAGADPDAPDAEGISALEIAREVLRSEEGSGAGGGERSSVRAGGEDDEPDFFTMDVVRMLARLSKRERTAAKTAEAAARAADQQQAAAQRAAAAEAARATAEAEAEAEAEAARAMAAAEAEAQAAQAAQATAEAEAAAAQAAARQNEQQQQARERRQAQARPSPVPLPPPPTPAAPPAVPPPPTATAPPPPPPPPPPSRQLPPHLRLAAARRSAVASSAGASASPTPLAVLSAAAAAAPTAPAAAAAPAPAAPAAAAPLPPRARERQGGEERYCVCCLDARPSVLLPCGHRVLCAQCAPQVQARFGGGGGEGGAFCPVCGE